MLLGVVTTIKSKAINRFRTMAHCSNQVHCLLRNDCTELDSRRLNLNYPTFENPPLTLKRKNSISILYDLLKIKYSVYDIFLHARLSLRVTI